MLFSFIMLTLALFQKPEMIKKVCTTKENRACVVFKYTYQNRTAVIGRDGNIFKWAEK